MAKNSFACIYLRFSSLCGHLFIFCNSGFTPWIGRNSASKEKKQRRTTGGGSMVKTFALFLNKYAKSKLYGVKIISNAICLLINRFDAYSYGSGDFFSRLILFCYVLFFVQCTACAQHNCFDVILCERATARVFACDNNCGIHCYIVQVIHQLTMKYTEKSDRKCEWELRFQDTPTLIHIHIQIQNIQYTYTKSMFLRLVICKRCKFLHWNTITTTTKIAQYFANCKAAAAATDKSYNNKRENAHTIRTFSRAFSS